MMFVDQTLDPEQLRVVDAAVQAALTAGNVGHLPVIGFGEVTTVLAWPPHRPTHAVKRLPLFVDDAQLRHYVECVEEYLHALGALGVRVAPTTVERSGADDRGMRAFMVQPLAPASALLSSRLAMADSDAAGRLLTELCHVIVRSVGPTLGLDAQVSNWVVTTDGVEYIDVSTPMLRDGEGRDRLDARLTTSVYPAVLRPVLRRWVVASVLADYHDPRTVLRDVGANLHREGLGRHVPTLCDLARGRGIELSEREVHDHFVSNARMWRLLAGLRRADAWWQRVIRRRPYPSLLPPRTTDA
jgi:hypothetical protein